MVAGMCAMPTGRNQNSLLMPTIQGTKSRSVMARFPNFSEPALHISYPPFKTKSAGPSKQSPRSQGNYFRKGKGYSLVSSKAKYVHRAARFPAITNGISSTSSTPFPQKSRPHTMGSFPSIDSPLPRARSLPSQMSMSNDFMSRQTTRFITRESTKHTLRPSKSQNGNQARPILQREPTILVPSKHGFHQRSNSPTFKALVDVREYLEANLAKKIKEFLQSREGIRARNNSVMTDITSADVRHMTPEDATSAILNEYFEADVHGIDGRSVSDEVESSAGEVAETKETNENPKESTQTVQPTPEAKTFNFNLGYLREHLNDTRLLSLEIEEIEERYRLKHKSVVVKKSRRVIAPPVSDSLFLPFVPYKKTKRKEHKQYDDQTIAEENESRSSPEESDYEHTEAILTKESVKVNYKMPSPVRSQSPKVKKSFTMDDIDKKMAVMSETLKLTSRKISEAEQKGIVTQPPKAPDPEPEVEEKPKELTEKEKFQKMKDRMAQRKLHRQSRKESYLQYSMQLEHMSKLNKDFHADDDEGGNILASMTFKKIDNIMKFKTKKTGRLGLEVSLSDSDDDDDYDDDDDDEDDDGDDDS